MGLRATADTAGASRLNSPLQRGFGTRAQTILVAIVLSAFVSLWVQLSSTSNARRAPREHLGDFAPRTLDKAEPLARHHRDDTNVAVAPSTISALGSSLQDDAERITRTSRRQIHITDRRFSSQKRGEPAGPGDELPTPVHVEAPFGFGTDWTHSVSVNLSSEDHVLQDVIDPPWCYAAENRSFVEHVLDRRRSVDPYNRVASCVRTKDNGRYLPEWVAYHWALGVDEFVLYDDESVDDTRQVLDPFIRAGIVKFRRRRIQSERDRVAPLNECVQRYRDMRDGGDPDVPRYVILIDNDEYLSAGDLVSTLADTLGTYSTRCCLKVPRIQHGSSNFSHPPRGLVIENFVMHADPLATDLNGSPKVIVNMRPAKAEEGVFTRLTDPHGTDDCECDTAPVGELAVRHFSMTLPDFRDKTTRYWQRMVPATTEETERAFSERDLNSHRTEDMKVWSCVVRHLLGRAADGRGMLTGRPFPGLSPHHPVSHGVVPMDPFGEAELQRTEACMKVVQSTPTVAGTVWGSTEDPPLWLQKFCGARYIFVHALEATGGMEVIQALASHAWIKTHTGKNAMVNGGATLTSAMPTAAEKKGLTGSDIQEVCGCPERTWRGCWRLCPKIQRQLLEKQWVNRKRRQLIQDWMLRFKFKSEAGTPVVLAERDPDMFLEAKQGLFPSVSSSILSVRHPLCTPVVARGALDHDVAAGFEEWYIMWRHLLTEQIPKSAGGVWVVRYEDLLAQEVEVTSALWAVVGLPPVSPYPPDPFREVANTGNSRGYKTPTGPALAAHEPAYMAQTIARESPKHSTPVSEGNFRAAHDDKAALESEASRANTRVDSTGRAWGDEEKVRESGVRQAAHEGDGPRHLRGLIAGDAASRAPFNVRERVLPKACRERVLWCDGDPACAREMERSAVIMDFFGYSGSGPLLNSQRFLWNKEELVWLGKRLTAGDPPVSPMKHSNYDSGDESSVILPQAYAV